MGEGRDDDGADREAILARRRRLVAVALAGLASIGGACECGPTACLSIAVDRDAGPDTGPADAGEDGGPSDGGPDSGTT